MNTTVLTNPLLHTHTTHPPSRITGGVLTKCWAALICPQSPAQQAAQQKGSWTDAILMLTSPPLSCCSLLLALQVYSLYVGLLLSALNRLPIKLPNLMLMNTTHSPSLSKPQVYLLCFGLLLSALNCLPIKLPNLILSGPLSHTHTNHLHITGVLTICWSTSIRPQPSPHQTAQPKGSGPTPHQA